MNNYPPKNMSQGHTPTYFLFPETTKYPAIKGMLYSKVSDNICQQGSVKLRNTKSICWQREN